MLTIATGRSLLPHTGTTFSSSSVVWDVCHLFEKEKIRGEGARQDGESGSRAEGESASGRQRGHYILCSVCVDDRRS